MRRLSCLHRLLTALAVAASLVLAVDQPALANICRSIEAELTTISRGPSSRERQIAGGAAVEAQRLYAHMRSIGCDRQTFLFFGQPPPTECAGYRARLAQLQSAGRAAYGPDEGRKRQLTAMLASNNCRAAPAEPRSGPLTAGLFDDGTRRRGEINSDDIDRPRIEARIRGTGGKAVCVRTCDGYYFPLHVRGAALQEDGDKVCQSLCPAAETKIFFNPGEIENARSPDGETYGDLENAFRYRKTYDPSCFCRRPGEAIGEGQARVLNPLNRTTGEGFDVLNRDPDDDAPLRGMTPVPGRKQDTRLFGNRPPPAPPAPPQAPPDVPADRMVTSEQGEVREMRGKDGVTRSVRVIAPELSRGPSGAAVPSVQGRAPSP
jgi:Protein of unknown function (DUF2865)